MPFGYGSWSSRAQESKEITELSRKSKYKRPKGRSMKTNQNKLIKLKRIYRKLFKSSEKRKTGFCKTFPTEQSYLKQYDLKKPNINK